MKKNINSFGKLPESTLSERLIKLRKTAGLSQEALAENLNMEAKAYGKYEQGKTLPPIDRIIDLVRLYHTTSDYILLGKQQSPSEKISDYLMKLPEHKQKIVSEIVELLILYVDDKAAF